VIADLSGWVCQFFGAIVLISVLVGAVAAPRKTNKEASPWDRRQL